ncbi:unnamed protein product, partial [Ascophyllum nodosum]
EGSPPTCSSLPCTTYDSPLLRLFSGCTDEKCPCPKSWRVWRCVGAGEERTQILQKSRVYPDAWGRHGPDLKSRRTTASSLVQLLIGIISYGI